MTKRICLFFDRSYVDAHYCFREMAVQFLENEWEVDLYVSFDTTHMVPTFNSGHVRIFFIDHSKRGLSKLLLKIGLGRYQAIVATPQWALYWAAKIGRFCGIPVVCLSDEVYAWNKKNWSIAQKISRGQAKWKKREAWAHRQCVMTVALGEERFQLVKNENQLSDDHSYVIVPNAPAGRANKLASSYYREILGISKEKVVLLHSGGLGWTLLRPLIQVSDQWGGELTLALQGRFKDTRDLGLPKENVKLSSIVLPSELMKYATSSADIGLLLYNRDHAEEARNGNTAGKLGLYLSCGLPVICCNLDVFRWVDKEKCGVWISHVSEIQEAVRKIMNSYETYQKNAIRIFNDQYEYTKHFDIFLKKLENFMDKKSN